MLEKAQAAAFDYGAVDIETRRKLEKKASAIQRRALLGTRAYLEVGRHLLEVKGLLPHGSFGGWVEAHCVFTAHTATNLMNAARFADEHKDLPPLDHTSLVLLSAPRLEPPLRDRLIKAVQAGMTSPTELRAVIKSEKARSVVASKDEVDRDDDAMTELVSILVGGLAEADLGRVRAIIAGLRGSFERLSELLSRNGVTEGKESRKLLL